MLLNGKAIVLYSEITYLKLMCMSSKDMIFCTNFYGEGCESAVNINYTDEQLCLVRSKCVLRSVYLSNHVSVSLRCLTKRFHFLFLFLLATQ
jgi:hypothetical protein